MGGACSKGKGPRKDGKKNVRREDHRSEIKGSNSCSNPSGKPLEESRSPLVKLNGPSGGKTPELKDLEDLIALRYDPTEEEEDKNQSHHVINLIQLAKEKFRLVIMSEYDDEIKTLCLQPFKMNRQAFQTNKFKSTPIRIREKFTQSTIKRFKKETRTRFQDTSSFPYSVHGLVRAELGNGSYVTGTGILIGANLVLTAAHNVYDYQETKEKYAKIEFIPGINDHATPFGVFTVIESYVPDEYLETWEQEDYALLVLNGSPGTRAGYFGLHVAEKKLLKGKEIHILGYPGYVKDKNNELQVLSSEGKHQLWGMSAKTWFFEDDTLISYSDILTTAGQSGSGVYYRIEGTDEYYIIGIHVLGGDAHNSATWITRKRFDRIKEWIGQSKRNAHIEKAARSKTESKVLDLTSKNIGDSGIELLSRHEFSRIEFLELEGNKITETGIEMLIHRWPNLTSLNLRRNNLGAKGATSLSRNISWKNLTKLNLRANKIGDDGAAGLSENTSWKNLKELDLSLNSISGKGAEGLGGNITWTNLTTIDLSQNSVGDEGAKALGKNVSWKNLVTLDLSWNRIGDAGAIGLSSNYAWTSLQTLKLGYNTIQCKGAVALSQNTVWESIKTVDLAGNKIGDEGAKVISKNTSWKLLTLLLLSENKFGNEGANCLRMRWPDKVVFI